MNKETKKLIAKRNEEMHQHLDLPTWDTTAETTEPNTDWLPILVGIALLVALAWAAFTVVSLAEVVML